jgi:phage baseplate assembly protein W
MPVAWPTLADPVTPALPVAVETRSETGRSIDTSGVTGRGIIRPFRRDRKSDFANGRGAVLIAANIEQILGTICSSEVSGGEVPWRTEFGSLLHLLRLRNNSPALEDEARAYVVLAIQRWEPRARILSCAITRDVQAGKMTLRIRWAPQSSGTERVVVAGLETEIALG